MGEQEKAAPRRRDPERRRREILEAAAEIVVTRGPSALTHRAIAAHAGIPLGTITRHFPSIDALRETALETVGTENEAELDVVQRELTNHPDPAARLAELMHEDLLDIRQAHASIAMITAAVHDDRLRSLARRWSERLTEILTAHCDPESARAMARYVDGALVETVLSDGPPSTATMTRALRALMSPSPAEGE